MTVDGVDYNSVLVGDMTPDDGNSCAPLRLDANGIPIASDLAAVTADPNCWSFVEMFPGGFTPTFGGTVTDSAIAGGVKGELVDEVFFDLSASYGRNEAEFKINNTVNASLGANSPTSFSPGTYVQSELGLNMDLFREFEVGLYDAVVLAGGMEWREDTFEVKAGDVASYSVGCVKLTRVLVLALTDFRALNLKPLGRSVVTTCPFIPMRPAGFLKARCSTLLFVMKTIQTSAIPPTGRYQVYLK